MRCSLSSASPGPDSRLHSVMAHLPGDLCAFFSLSCRVLKQSLIEVHLSVFIPLFQRQFLNAGKHVLVEYPMTLSWVAAKDLWELAEQKGDVCSVRLERTPSY